MLAINNWRGENWCNHDNLPTACCVVFSSSPSDTEQVEQPARPDAVNLWFGIGLFLILVLIWFDMIWFGADQIRWEWRGGSTWSGLNSSTARTKTKTRWSFFFYYAVWHLRPVVPPYAEAGTPGSIAVHFCANTSLRLSFLLIYSNSEKKKKNQLEATLPFSVSQSASVPTFTVRYRRNQRWVEMREITNLNTLQIFVLYQVFDVMAFRGYFSLPLQEDYQNWTCIRRITTKIH